MTKILVTYKEYLFNQIVIEWIYSKYISLDYNTNAKLQWIQTYISMKWGCNTYGSA